MCGEAADPLAIYLLAIAVSILTPIIIIMVIGIIKGKI